MTIPALHVEAKLHAFRKTQDGVVVSFVVSPIDIPPALALDPLGTRYMLALAQIGDDEQPVPPAGNPQPQAQEPTQPPSRREEPKERRPWDSLSPQQQAGILCADKGFQKWVCNQAGETWWGRDLEEQAASWLRERLGVQSRRELADNAEARAVLAQIRAEFMRDAGRVLEVR